MKRDIFCRGVRMQHQFGGLETRNDPLEQQTFDPPWPKRVQHLSEQNGSSRELRDLYVQRDGQYGYRDEPAAVCKPYGGYATLDGPKPDVAQDIAMPIPVGTKRRYGPLKTDK